MNINKKISEEISSINEGLVKVRACLKDKDDEIAALRKVLKQVDDTIYDAMGEAGVPGKALLSMKWARKLILLASGQPDADQ